MPQWHAPCRSEGDRGALCTLWRGVPSAAPTCPAGCFPASGPGGTCPAKREGKGGCFALSAGVRDQGRLLLQQAVFYFTFRPAEGGGTPLAACHPVPSHYTLRYGTVHIELNGAHRLAIPAQPLQQASPPPQTKHARMQARVGVRIHAHTQTHSRASLTHIHAHQHHHHSHLHSTHTHTLARPRTCRWHQATPEISCWKK